MEQDTKIKILVVEDDISLKDSLVRLLQNRDFLVQAVENKQQAVEQIKSGQQYDIYLLDVWLPDGNGFDICHEIRKISQAIVMFLTSCDDEESITKGLDIGGDDYITKPCKPAQADSTGYTGSIKNIRSGFVHAAAGIQPAENFSQRRYQGGF